MTSTIRTPYNYNDQLVNSRGKGKGNEVFNNNKDSLLPYLTMIVGGR